VDGSAWNAFFVGGCMAKNKVGVVMREFKHGTLHSGSGAKVTNPKQAVAIGMSEARKRARGAALEKLRPKK